MAWLCVDKDGGEIISSEKLERYPFLEKEDKRKKNQILSIDQQFSWTWPYYCSENLGEIVYLPKGTIKKILGYSMKWEDEPIEIT